MDNSHRECRGQRTDTDVRMARRWDGKSQCKRCRCSLAKPDDAWVVRSCGCKYCYGCMNKVVMSSWCCNEEEDIGFDRGDVWALLKEILE